MYVQVRLYICYDTFVMNVIDIVIECDDSFMIKLEDDHDFSYDLAQQYTGIYLARLTILTHRN